jgi:hypothetical protein
MKINLRPLGLPLLCLLAIIILGRSTNAATQQPQGITVSPAFQQVSVPDGAAQQPVNFSLTNNESAPLVVNLSTADFNTLDESGGLFFVGTNPTALQKKYGLAKWLSLPEQQITLLPKQTKIINANILNLSDFNGGGHYGALMIALAGGQSGANSVGVKPIASSLLFVTKVPGDTHRLSLSNVYVKHSLVSLPKNVTLRFFNNGNTHVVPRGTVRLTNPRDQLVSQGIIDQNSGIILPGSYRVYQVNLNEVSSANAVGSYQLTVDFRFDGINQIRRYQTSFAYVPIVYVTALVIILIGLVVLVIIIMHKRSRHKKKTIKVIVK